MDIPSIVRYQQLVLQVQGMLSLLLEQKPDDPIPFMIHHLETLQKQQHYDGTVRQNLADNAPVLSNHCNADVSKKQLYGCLWDRPRTDRGGEWKSLMEQAQVAVASLDVPTLMLHNQPELIELLLGHRNALLENRKNQVAMYLSSTIDDNVAEREVLWGDAFPYLRSVFQVMGLAFELVDLSGVETICNKDGSNSITEYDLCRKELQRCKSSGLGPKLVVLRGEKYREVRATPKHIPSKQYERILQQTDPKSVHFLQEAYQYDANGNGYLLKPLYSPRELPSVAGCYQDIEAVEADCPGSTLAFIKGINKINVDGDSGASMFLDVVDRKLDNDAHSLLMTEKRKIKSKVTNCFEYEMDWGGLLPQRKVLDPAHHGEYLRKFTDDFCRSVVKSVMANYNPNAHVVAANSLLSEIALHQDAWKHHTRYFSGRESLVSNVMKRLTAPARFENGIFLSDVILLKGKGGSGKTAILSSIVERLSSSPSNAVIFRHLGLSKGSLEAKQLLKSVLLQLESIQRIINGDKLDFSPRKPAEKENPAADDKESNTAEKEEIFFDYDNHEESNYDSTTNSWLDRDDDEDDGDSEDDFIVCRKYHDHDGNKKRHRHSKHSPTSHQEHHHPFISCLDWKDLVVEFNNCFHCFDEDEDSSRLERIYIVLDGLDQLDGDDAAKLKEWVPHWGSDRVRIILSCLDAAAAADDDDENNRWIRQLPTDLWTCIDIEDMSPDDGWGVVEKRLKLDQRQLTIQQEETLAAAFKDDPIAINLALLHLEARHWTANQVPVIIRPATTAALMTSIVEKLEKKLGLEFVQLVLGCLSVAKHGLTIGEMQDLCSCNEQVMIEVLGPPDESSNVLPLRRLPAAYTSLLRQELEPFLLCLQGGQRFQLCSHFRRFCSKRYSNNRRAFQWAMASYFASCVDDAAVYTTSLVDPNPLVRSNNTINMRSLEEVPNHLLSIIKDNNGENYQGKAKSLLLAWMSKMDAIRAMRQCDKENFAQVVRESGLESALTEIWSQLGKQKSGKEDLEELALLLSEFNCPLEAAEIWKRLLDSYGENLALDVRANMLYNLGTCLELVQEKTGEALDCFQQARKYYFQFYQTPNHITVANSLNKIGTIQQQQRRYEEAADAHAKAKQIRVEICGLSHPDTATSFSQLGHALLHLGKFNEAISNYLQARDIFLRIHGPDHADVAVALSDIGNGYYEQGLDLEKALAFLSQAKQVRINLYGPVHSLVADTITSIANVYRKQAKYDEAMREYLSAKEMYHVLHGPQHMSIVNVMMNMAKMFQKQENYDQSLEYYRRALDMVLVIRGNEKQTEIAEIKLEIGHIMHHCSKPGEGLTYVHEAHDILIELYGQNHPGVQKALNYITKLSGVSL